MQRSYLRFDRGNIDSVTAAVLRVHTTASSAKGFVVRPVTSVSWPEATTTWKNKPALATGSTSSGPISPGWVSVDVTSLLRWSGSLASLALVTSSTTGVPLDSRETANAPQLLLSGPAPSPSSSPTPTVPPPPPSGSVLVAAVGDLVCAPSDPSYNGGLGTATGCRHMAVSDLALAGGPSALLALGDLQYWSGSLHAFNTAYAPSYGRLRSITKPVPGNHEYQDDPTAAGYFTYFGALAADPAKGYYSFELGAWHAIALNSNCANVGGCEVGSPQHTWLLEDLSAHPNTCTLAFWHHPRFSSGPHDDDPAVDAFWRALSAAGADLVLSGHDHDYERFALMLADGTAGSGRGAMRQFVVGTGGKDLRPFDATISAHSEVREASTHGLLWLTLRPDGYDWRFEGLPGSTFSDAGSEPCR